MCGIRNITGVAPELAETLFLWRDAESGSRDIRYRCWHVRIAQNAIARVLRRDRLDSER